MKRLADTAAIRDNDGHIHPSGHFCGSNCPKHKPRTPSAATKLESSVERDQRELWAEFEEWLTKNQTLSAPFKATVFGYVGKLCENAREIGRWENRP